MFLTENQDDHSTKLIHREALPGLVIPFASLEAIEEGYKRMDLALKEKFYGDCSDEDVNFAMPLLIFEASAPFISPISIAEENFGRIPLTYISCLRARAISPTVQKQMYTNLPCQKIIKMDSGHAPFFSAPVELSKHLLSI